MDKFTKVQKNKSLEKVEKEKEKSIKYQSGKMKVREIEKWTIIDEPDMVVCIPYLIEENAFLIRQEYIPTYKYVNGEEFYAVVMSETMEDGETPAEALHRGLQEEMGIKVRDGFDFDFEAPLFVSKGCMAKYNPIIISLSRSDYDMVTPTGDGSEAEAISKTIKVSAAYVSKIFASDVITELMLMKFMKWLGASQK